MNSERRDQIEAELTQIRNLLTKIPVRAKLERLGLEVRESLLQSELDRLPLDEVRPTSKLVFRGKGVAGSRGIFAGFGSKATKSFSDAYSAIVASLNENLAYMGRIPDRGNHELLITGTAVGSFGFKMEMPAFEPDLIFDGETLESRAMHKLLQLMEQASEGTDDEVAELVDDVHPRAVRKVSEFLDLVARSESTLALDIEGEFFRFDDVEDITRSAKRLAEENIREFKDYFKGAFIGFLPESRTFEFRTDQGVIIKGRVSGEISEPEVINSELLQKYVNLCLNVIQVGQGRPRYALEKLEDIKPINETLDD